MPGSIYEGGNPKNLTASGAISPGPCTLLGFYVNSTNAGTVQIKDGGAGGTALGGVITPAAGTFHRYPAAIGSSAYASIGGTAIDVTFFFVPAA